MTEQPDTAKIRAEFNAITGRAATPVEAHVDWLCDALDAARAELRTVNGCLAAQDENEARQRARAEAAEARIRVLESEDHDHYFPGRGDLLNRIAQLEHTLLEAPRHDEWLITKRATAAEARIANALAVDDGWSAADQAQLMRRALTEGTGR